MNSNDFLPFATGSSPTIISQAVYAALIARGTGFQAGIADETQLNKVWRQASIIAAMVGQFTADFGPGNVVDDGNVSGLEAQFEAALYGYLKQSFLPFVPATTFYVNSSTGNDSNPGTLAQPFATLQGAVNYISQYESPSVVTINATGTFTAGCVIPQSNIAAWYFIGAGGATIAATSAGGRCFNMSASTVLITGFVMSAYYECISVNGASKCYIGTNTFTLSANSNTIDAINGSQLFFGWDIGPETPWQATPTITYTGSATAPSFVAATSGANVQMGYHDVSQSVSPAFVASGATTFSNGWAAATQGGSFSVNPSYCSFSGPTPTGRKFYNYSAGGIQFNGGGTSFFPGTLAGYNDSTSFGWTTA